MLVAMTLLEKADLVLTYSGRWMTPAEIGRSIKAMFAETPDDAALTAALDAEPSVSRFTDRYCVHPTKRAERLAAEFGFPIEA